jgi:hypothetical protein
MRPALIFGIIFMAFGLMNLFMIPGHPTWFWSELLFYVPLALLGGRLATGGSRAMGA